MALLAASLATMRRSSSGALLGGGDTLWKASPLAAAHGVATTTSRVPPLMRFFVSAAPAAAAAAKQQALSASAALPVRGGVRDRAAARHLPRRRRDDKAAAEAISLGALLLVTVLALLARNVSAAGTAYLACGACVAAGGTRFRSWVAGWRRRARAQQRRLRQGRWLPCGYGAAADPSAAERLAADALAKERRCDLPGAVAAYERAVAAAPDDARLLALYSKVVSDQVLDEEVYNDDRRARDIASRAAESSERAIRLDPRCPLAHAAHAVNLGRLALWSPNQRKIEISKDVKAACDAALALDPEYDLAYALLARWEYEMASVGFLVRAIIRVVYGGLEQGSFENCLVAMQKAHDLQPDRLVHHAGLAKCLHRMGRHAEALVHARRALELEVEDINAVGELKFVRNLLPKLEKLTQ